MTRIAEWFHSADRKYAVGFLWGTALSLIGIWLSIQDRKPAITFTTVAESNVLDVHTPLPELDIRYRGASLQSAGHNLKIITLRVANTGDVDILPSHYDPRAPWGFYVTAGRIAEVRVLSASSDYVRETIAPAIVQPNRVALGQIMLDTNASAELQLLVLHPATMQPAIRAAGKVAGISSFAMERLVEEDEKTEWISVRSVVTALALVVAMIVVVMALDTVSRAVGRWRSRRRRREVAFALRNVRAPAKMKEIIEGIYATRGAKGLREVVSLLADPTVLEEHIRALKEREALRQRLFDQMRSHADLDSEGRPVDTFPYIYSLDSALSWMENANLLKVSDSRVVVDERFKKVADEVARQLASTEK